MTSSRTQQRARSMATRERLLDVTLEVLAEEGYAATSTLKIQERAGMSRGRLLHQYPSRDALLIDAVQHIAVARFDDLLRGAEAAVDGTRVRSAIELLWSSYDGRLFWAAMELWLASRTNEALRQALAPAERRLGLVVRDLADTLFGPDVTSLPMYGAVRDLLISSMRGTALTYAFERRPLSSEPHIDHWEQLALRCLGLDGAGSD